MDPADGRRRARLHVPAAKLAAPQPLGLGLPRSRLLQQLDGARQDQLVLLSAPAGHGKTVLLAEWAAQRPEHVVWVSLEAADRADAVFWSALLTGVIASPAMPADAALRSVVVPNRPSADLDFLAAVTDALSALDRPVLLVLDDLHRIAGSEAMAGLDALIRYRPRGLRLILSTRRDPGLPLSRLRLEGRLVELRADDLALTAEETATLLRLLRLDLTGDQAALVHEQTGGWVAGVRLAALSLRETDDQQAFLADLVGNDRAIADYLVTEVLSRMPTEVRDLLSRLCVCEQVSAPLAVELSGNERAAELLTEVEHDWSLVACHGPGRRWFRIHPLLRSYLKADLRRRDPVLKRHLYARAARGTRRPANQARRCSSRSAPATTSCTASW